jgi:hypothetical protein
MITDKRELTAPNRAPMGRPVAVVGWQLGVNSSSDPPLMQASNNDIANQAITPGAWTAADPPSA